MNLKALTDDLFARVDWDPSPTTRAVQIVHSFLNRAIAQIVNDAPFLFYEEPFILRTQPDVVPTLASDTLSLVTDDEPTGALDNLWVMYANLVPGSTTGQVAFPLDRAWDGRMLEVTDASGVKRRTRIRSVYLRTVEVSPGVNANRIFITLWNPWNADDWGTGPFATWRIYTPKYYLPDDVIEVKNLRILHEGEPYPIQYISQPEAENLGLAEHGSTQAGGSPLTAHRAGYFRMHGPKVAPVATVVGEDPWLGPEPPGKFEYVITYCWGKRDAEWANPGIGQWNAEDMEWLDNSSFGTTYSRASHARFIEPMWESSPSPLSNQVTVAAPDGQGNPGKAVVITLPNIEWVLGFLLEINDGSSTKLRSSVAHSGWFVRIYRRRLTEDFTNYSSLPTGGGFYSPSLSKLDFDDNHYLLAEMKIDHVNNGIFKDDGSILPDIHRPLRQINGYEAIRFTPHPDGEYLVEGRALRTPAKLVSEYDAPHIKPGSSDLIVERALVYFYERLGDPSRAGDAERRYEKVLAQTKRRYSDGIPGSQAIRRRPTRFPLYSRHPKWRR